jgi:hypothetical protein
LQFLDLAVLFEKFIQQHRIHVVISHALRLPSPLRFTRSGAPAPPSAVFAPGYPPSGDGVTACIRNGAPTQTSKKAVTKRTIPKVEPVIKFLDRFVVFIFHRSKGLVCVDENGHLATRNRFDPHHAQRGLHGAPGGHALPGGVTRRVLDSASRLLSRLLRRRFCQYETTCGAD